MVNAWSTILATCVQEDSGDRGHSPVPDADEDVGLELGAGLLEGAGDVAGSGTSVSDAASDGGSLDVEADNGSAAPVRSRRGRGPSFRELVRVQVPGSALGRGLRVVAKVIGAAVARNINTSPRVTATQHKTYGMVTEYRRRGGRGGKGTGCKKQKVHRRVLRDEWVVVSGASNTGAPRWRLKVRLEDGTWRTLPAS